MRSDQHPNAAQAGSSTGFESVGVVFDRQPRFRLAHVGAIMRMIFLAAAVLGAFGVNATASAADMKVKAKAPPPPPASPFWIEADYLAWRVKGDKLPALVSTGPLGAPGTTVLFGDAAVNDRWRSGEQIKAGYWFDPQHRWGVEGSFFGLQDVSTGFNAGSNGSPTLARPFFNVVTGAQDSIIVASPAVASGQIAINETSRLFGAGFALRKEICTGCAGGHISALVGYRFLRTTDGLTIATNQQGNLFFIGPFTLAASDAFATGNDFNGLDLGLTGESHYGAWTLEWLGKVAVGANYSTAQVNGVTTITAGGASVTAPGGLLALPSNMGNFSQTRFAFVPELAVRVGYQVTPHVRVHAGYDFLFWSNVVRPGNVIDTGINPNQIPPGVLAGPSRPAPRLDGADFWAQGFNLGAVFSF
jgi:Putative beta barrel porin-7 (BBP7)